jgi:acyl-CoA synthetase (AMP-forming)/AMP-acid ligase II
MRKAKPKKRIILPDPVFNDVKVSKFVNHLMYDGKKNTSYEIFYAALETVKNINTDTLRTQMDEFLPKYHSPKYILITHSIPQTGSGKIDRAGCKELAQRLMEQH